MDADKPESLVPLINEDIFKKLLEEKVIHSGMIPKLENALNALNKGVANVWMGLPENLLLAAKGEEAGTIIKPL